MVSPFPKSLVIFSSLFVEDIFFKKEKKSLFVFFSSLQKRRCGRTSKRKKKGGDSRGFSKKTQLKERERGFVFFPPFFKVEI